MKIPRRSGKLGAMDSAVNLALATALRNDTDAYSTSLEFALDELVREKMRSIAQQQLMPRTSSLLLKAAMQEVTSELSVAMEANHLQLELSRYGTQLQKGLVQTAKEIHKLGSQLSVSRSQQRLADKEELQAVTGARFVVQKLGLREAIHGPFVEAPASIEDINIEGLHEMRGWRIEGEWFPYEVYAPNDAMFVIDDDGSIFTSTEGLPDDLLRSTYSLIRKIAEILYR